jgi:hypothetical protein
MKKSRGKGFSLYRKLVSAAVLPVVIFFSGSVSGDKLDPVVFIGRIAQMESGSEYTTAHASEFFSILEKNPDFNLNMHTKAYEQFHSTDFAEYFSTFLVDLHVKSIIRDDSVLTDLSGKVASQVYPSASPVIYNMRKIGRIHSQSHECVEKNNIFCFAEIVATQNDTALPQTMLTHLMGRFSKDSVSSFSEEVLYGLLAAMLLYPDQSDFCSKYFSGEHEDFRLYERLSELTELDTIVKMIEGNSQCYNELLSHVYDRMEYAVTKKHLVSTRDAFRFIRYLEQSEERFHEAKLHLAENASSPIRPVVREYLSYDIFKSLATRNKISIIFLGFMPSKFYFILLVLLLFTPLIFFLLYRISDLAVVSQEALSHSVKGAFKRKSRITSQYPEGNDRVDEYTSLLTVFGLTDEATDADIKKSYREIIKKLHPDSGNIVEQKKLEDIQKAYDRLMELRRGWFGLSR